MNAGTETIERDAQGRFRRGCSKIRFRPLAPREGGEGTIEIAAGRADPASPPLFSPHLRRLIEASMANPADNRWLAVLDEEWGLNGRLALHLPCNSQAPPASAMSAAPAP